MSSITSAPPSARPSVDSQALCSAVWAFGSVTHQTIPNNIVDLIEEGFKWQEVYYQITNVSNFVDVENNRMLGQSRILTENQQATNGTAIFSHNSHYAPYNPGLYTFEDSLPGNGGFQVNDNVYEAGVFQVYGHYGYGLEIWGANATGQHNLFQGANTGFSAGACGAGFFCQGWGVIMGPGNTSQSWTNNYFSGTDVWNGNSNAPLNLAFEKEDGGVIPGPTLTPNTVVQTSTTLATTTPVISPNGGSFAGPVTVTLSDPDSAIRNLSIFYTTDGSTPAPFVIGGSAGTSQVYTAPFAVPLGTTVKAIAQWGIGANQGISFPSFGWVPSSVTAQTYSSGGTITLQTVTVSAPGGGPSVQVGSTLQLSATCHYSDGSTTPCNTLDIHGNVVTAWTPSNGNLTVNGSGLVTGQAIGTTTVTATVTGGMVSSPGLTVTVSASPLTLTSLTVATTGGVSSIMAASNNQLIATCHYNDGSSDDCTLIDGHGNDAGNFLSSNPASATVVSSTGLVTGVAAGSTNLTAKVTPAPSMLGTDLQNVTGSSNNGAINEIYGVTGTSVGGYTPGDCHITIPATSNWTAGKHWACLLVLGTPITQNAAALCSNTYTMTGTSWPGGDVVIPMASVCPALPPDQGYWIGSSTDQTAANPVQGFSNCNSACSGGVPVFGSGTYPYRYVANSYGNYTNLPTSLTASGTPGQQVSQYLLLTTTPVNSSNLPLTVTSPPPSLVSAYLTATGSSLVVPKTLQMAAKCHYTSGADQDCTVADIYGDAVTQWNTSDATKATIGAVGSANPGLVTAVAAGTPSITARIAGTGPTSAAYPITVTNAPVTLTGISLSTTGGVTGLFVGFTNQLKATCTYSDGSSDDCTTTDAHGTLAHSYVSTTPAHATVNATSGLVTGVAAGSTTFTAVAGSFTSNAVPLAVFPVLSGVYTITISGPVKFSGTVRF